MATIKTNRDFLKAVANGTINDEVKAFAKAQISKLDDKNEKHKVSKSVMAHKTENENIKSAILAGMKPNQTYVSADLAKAFEISIQKVSALMTQLVKEKKVIKVEGVKSAKGKVMGYHLAETAPTEDSAETAPTEDSAD